MVLCMTPTTRFGCVDGRHPSTRLFALPGRLTYGFGCAPLVLDLLLGAQADNTGYLPRDFGYAGVERGGRDAIHQDGLAQDSQGHPPAGRLHDVCGHTFGLSSCPDCSALSEPTLHGGFDDDGAFRPGLDGPRLGARDSSALFHWGFGWCGGFVSSGGATATAGDRPAVYNVPVPGFSVPMLAVWTEVCASTLDSYMQTCHDIPSACAWHSVSNLFGR